MNAKVIYCCAIQNNILAKSRNLQTVEEKRPREETYCIYETLMDMRSHHVSFSFPPTGLPRSGKIVCSTVSFFSLLYSQLFIKPFFNFKIHRKNQNGGKRTLMSNRPSSWKTTMIFVKFAGNSRYSAGIIASLIKPMA